MVTNFDMSFENAKADFQRKFGKNWNEDPQLYLTYLQTLYIANSYEKITSINSGINHIISNQTETHGVIRDINKKLEEKK